jgi:excisionase family DNA binding protein
MATERALAPGSQPREARHRGQPADAELRPLLTIEQVAHIFGVSSKTVRRLVAGRRLPCVRLGRVLRFQQADLLRFVEARKE